MSAPCRASALRRGRGGAGAAARALLNAFPGAGLSVDSGSGDFMSAPGRASALRSGRGASLP
eukprot:13529474-Alexandrium_andersonii.AAC.1